MISYFKTSILSILLTHLLVNSAFAIDFDQDGFDDFVLVDINSKDKLEWYAIDVNDTARRALGQFGKAGDHLAVGNWSGSNNSSKALIKQRSNGDFEWNIQLTNGQKNLLFGKYPEKAVSGLDTDNNGAIDPAIVSAGSKTLVWKVLPNPATGVPAYVQEYNFGGKKDLPFYANIDGKGDKIATAKVSKKGTLTIRYLNLSDSKVKTYNIKNYNSKISKILPVSLASGKDVIFVISKQGRKINASIIKGGKIIKKVSVAGDEIVVGKYLGSNSEVLVVRNKSNKAIFISSNGKKSSKEIDLNAVLVDDVNINTFKKSDNTNEKPPAISTPAPSHPAPSPPTEPPPGGYPVCSGVAISTDHLLYKPVSDTTGNVVLVFDSKYSREFLSVKIQLRDGSFAEGWWKGLELWGNPDAFGPRQHWRTNVRSSDVKDNALIIVDDTSQECRFMLPGSARNRWE